MAKIIKIQDDVVSVGTDDGNFFTVASADLNFKPSVGDEVDVFKNGDTPLVVKREKTVSQNPLMENALLSDEEMLSPKSRAASSVLCFFLGTLGVHNFYLGRIGRGICQLVLFLVGCATEWLLIGTVPLFVVGVWVLIEFVIILVGACKDGEGRLVKNW